MSIISIPEYKELFEKLISDTSISEVEFVSMIEDLIYQAPLGAMQRAIPFVIRTSLLDKSETCLNVSRCSYVPDLFKEKIPLQRCNIEGQQVFYASIPGGMINFSDGAQPSLMETTMQRIIDDPTFDSRQAAVSRWQIKEQPLFWFLTHNGDSIKNNENFNFLFGHTDSFLKEVATTNQHHQNFTKKLEYLSQLFCRNDIKERIYKVTAKYYNTVMSLFKPFDKHYDALIYPSANTKGEGMNIVLTKEYVDNKNIFCDLVILYEIKRSSKSAKNIWFEPFAQAKPDEFGNLDFKPLDKSMI